MKAVFLLFFTFLSLLSCAQGNAPAPAPAPAPINVNMNSTDSLTDIAFLQSFVKDLADENIALDVILSQYIIVEEPSDDIYDYLEVSLKEVRINVSSKNIADIQYRSYKDMPKKEIRDIDTEDLNINSMYFLHYKNRQMLAVYMEDHKIASFTLVAKGNNKAHFVLY